MVQKKLSPVGAIVLDIARALVDFSDDVEIREVDGEQVTVLEVLVRQQDHGRVVGRRGRLVDSIRQILTCFNGIHRHHYLLEVLEEESGTGRYRSTNAHQPRVVDPIHTSSELLERLIRGIVDEPRAVRINTLDGIQVAVFEIVVAPGDNRRVIGRNGRTVTALREILLSVGRRHRRRFMLELIETGQQ